MTRQEDREARQRISAVLEAAGRSRLEVRGNCLDVAASHYREVFRGDPSGEKLREVVTADAAAYERYLLTGETYTGSDAVPVSRSQLADFLRELDLEQGRTDQGGGREVAWHYWRGEMEKLLGLESGALYAGNPDGSYPEAEEEPKPEASV